MRGERESHVYDVIVLGAGCAGLACAVFCALRGASVLVAERAMHVGGVTAVSAGSVWVPNSHHAGGVNSEDTRDAARRYLLAASEGKADQAHLDQFLDAGPRAIAELEERTAVKFRAYPRHPDYLSSLPGSTTAGRAMEPLPFDGRRLGRSFSLLRPPLPEFTILGGMMVDRTDISHLLGMKGSARSALHAMKIIGRHAIDRLSYSRGTRLVMGNALIGRLMAAALDLGISIRTGVKVTEVNAAAHGGLDVSAMIDDRVASLQARRAVVLATGGFNRDEALRTGLPETLPVYTPGQIWGTSSGHRLLDGLTQPDTHHTPEDYFWAPVSIRKRPDGSTAVFPHFVFDRAKPGTLVIDQSGQRFLNESLPYHYFGLEMIRHFQRTGNRTSYLVADEVAMRRYGLGIVRPGGMGLRSALADGYVIRATDSEALARALDVPADALATTLEHFGTGAAAGLDPDFARGTTEYERNLGDPSVRPNPTLRPLARGPLYALRLFPGDIGVNRGIATDEFGGVMTGNGPVPGLFAIGNDRNSYMGGAYPGPGITLGQAIASAHIAAERIMSAPAPDN